MFGGDFGFGDVDIILDLDKDVDVSVGLGFDPGVAFHDTADIDWNFEVCPSVEGNTATFNVEVDALGGDSAVGLSLFVLTTDHLSQISVSWSALAG